MIRTVWFMAFAMVLQSCSLLEDPYCRDLESTLKTLIEELGIPNMTPGPHERSEGKQAQILKKLEDLGKPAMPFIVKYMDDRRLLPYQYMALENKFYKTWETYRQYLPLKVVDALAGVLGQIISLELTPIYHNGRNTTENERDKAVAVWRDYLRYSKDSYPCHRGD